jgi:hypothetical protein
MKYSKMIVHTTNGLQYLKSEYYQCTYQSDSKTNLTEESIALYNIKRIKLKLGMEGTSKEIRNNRS